MLGERQNRLVRYARGVDTRSSRGSNEAQFTPSLHEDIHWVPAFIGILGRILDQQANRHTSNGSTPALWAISSLND